MTRYRIKVCDEQDSHYLVEAPDEQTALLMASLIDQYSLYPPTNPDVPREVDYTTEVALAKAYATAKEIA